MRPATATQTQIGPPALLRLIGMIGLPARLVISSSLGGCVRFRRSATAPRTRRGRPIPIRRHCSAGWERRSRSASRQLVVALGAADARRRRDAVDDRHRGTRAAVGAREAAGFRGGVISMVLMRVTVRRPTDISAATLRRFAASPPPRRPKRRQQWRPCTPIDAAVPRATPHRGGIRRRVVPHTGNVDARHPSVGLSRERLLHSAPAVTDVASAAQSRLGDPSDMSDILVPSDCSSPSSRASRRSSCARSSPSCRRWPRNLPPDLRYRLAPPLDSGCPRPERRRLGWKGSRRHPRRIRSPSRHRRQALAPGARADRLGRARHPRPLNPSTRSEPCCASCTRAFTTS